MTRRPVQVPDEWWYGHLTCDLKHHESPVVPSWWWEGISTTLPRAPILLCDEGYLELTTGEYAIDAAEFTRGELVGPGHWRPSAP